MLQLIKSVCLVGITEGFGLLERFLPPDSQREIMPIILNTPLACDYLKNKIDMIFHKNFNLVEQSLQNLGKDIKLALEMSNESSGESMILTALVNQIFNHCQKLGYGDKDPSAIFLRIRH